MRIASFNVQNLRLRQRGGDWRLDGARDSDTASDSTKAAQALDGLDRRLTADVLRDADADVVALQEVFDQATLDYFHDHVLLPEGVAPYPYRVCLPGNDGRGLDVALMSRLPITEVVSHAALTPRDLGLEVEVHPGLGIAPDRPIFRRDCLMVHIGRLTLFLCHFKAPYPDEDGAWIIRRLEAQAVRHLIERRFAEDATAYWLMIGDLNEPAISPEGTERAIAPLIGDFSVDVLARLPDDQRWTYFDRESHLYSRPDAVLASPALARDWPDACPVILREGMGRESIRRESIRRESIRRESGQGARLQEVGEHRPHASDHAAIVIDFPQL